MGSCVHGTGWCGLCYSNVRARTNVKGHRMFRATKVDVSMGKYLQAKPAVPVPGPKGGVVTDVAFTRQLPALFEYLTLRSYENGTPRQTACMTVFCEDGLFKVCLNDRDAQRSAWVASETFQGALVALEAGLVEDSHQWRQARPQSRGKKS